MESELAVNAVLGDISLSLAERHELVLEAPPGAGKTTQVPLSLLQADWLGQQQILMLQPRRVAARACAEYMATLLGETVGETVGYRVRLDSRVGPNTRIEIVTEGVLTRRLQSDPGLEGVGLLIFDEFHERSLDADLGLALAMQGRELLRDDVDPLRILVMSATLDGEAVAGLLNQAPILRCEGRQYPVQLHYGAARKLSESVIDPCVRLLHQLMSEANPGTVLCFLPGQGEIRRVQQQLQLPDDVQICPLYGGLKLAQQRAAIDPPQTGERKLVLATNIAETSLTIAGVHTVVDSGLERVARYDPNTGMTRLHTQRISRASSVQRMGRAGRLGPGQCYRLWSEEQQDQLAPQAAPEILQADLTDLVLQLLNWGVQNSDELGWLDQPPAGAWQQALQLLDQLALSVLDGERRQLTPLGQQVANLPMHPRLGRMLALACECDQLELGSRLAALFGERFPDEGSHPSVESRLQLLRNDQLKGALTGWRQRVLRQAKDYQRRAQDIAGEIGLAIAPEHAVGVLLASAWPDRVAQRQGQAEDAGYLLANGRRAQPSQRTTQQWLLAAELGGRGNQSEDRIYLSADLDIAALERALPELFRDTEEIGWDSREDRLQARTLKCIGAIELHSKAVETIDGSQRAEAVLAHIRNRGLDCLSWPDELQQWRARVQLVAAHEGDPWPDLSDDWLLANLEQWLAPYLETISTGKQLRHLSLLPILQALLPWPLSRDLDQLAPERLKVPSGSSIRIDYGQTPPVLAVKLQEMFQCEDTPRVVNGKQALLVHLLSPAGRPLQVTQDLAGFWRSSYQDVKKDMKGRYPKHPWPDDPLSAEATRYTKKRQGS